MTPVDDLASPPERPHIERLVAGALADLQLEAFGSATAWFDPPVVGMAAGTDPLFADFKRHVGPAHWTPLEALALGLPGAAVAADELTVISWILPHADATKRANRAESVLPAERWAQGKLHGEALNNALRERVVELLTGEGIATVAPVRLPAWTSADLASVWSERHIAYAAGLGTFGLCDGLITPAGKAMRCGSVVARTVLAPTPRPYADRHAYCLAFAEDRCRACAERCPAGAITDAGHDKRACLEYLQKVSAEYLRPVLGITTDACGLCQTGVPCESRIPARLRASRR